MELRGMRTQMRVIYAVIMREVMTRYGTSKLGYFWAFVEPISHVAIFGVLKSILSDASVAGVHPIPFLISGIVPYFLFSSTTNRCMGALSANKGLLVFPVVKNVDLYLGRAVLEFFTYLSVFLLSCLVCHLFIAPMPLRNFPILFYSFFILSAMGLGMGMILSAIVAVMPSFGVMITAVMRILYFTSGILYSIKLIPEEYWKWMVWNPLIHAIETFRLGLFIDYSTPEEFTDIGYASMVAMGLCLYGLILIAKMKPWMQR